MVRTLPLCVGLLAVGLLASRGASAQDIEQSIETLEIRAKGYGAGDRRYVVDIYRQWQGRFYSRSLVMRCISCTPEYVYRETVDDIPEYIFALSPQLVLIQSSTAVATGIRVYHLGEQVRLVLEFYGRGGPRYTYSEDGVPDVITFDYRDEDLLETYHRATWTWNGNEFVETKQCIRNCDAPRYR